MSVDIVMPQMGESITEGTVSKWLKQVGERVEKDEPVLEISTDKVDAEVPSPGAGTLLEIRTAEGETVEVGTVVAVIGEEGEAGANGNAPAASAKTETPPVSIPAAAQEIETTPTSKPAPAEASPGADDQPIETPPPTDTKTAAPAAAGAVEV